MIRTTLLYGVSVALALGVLVISLFAVTFRSVHAATPVATLLPAKTNPRPTVTPGTQRATETASLSPSAAEVNYPLPYPGLLPDSIFWPLKAIRDRILLWLTFGNKAQGDRMLFYGDKRLAAAQVLIDGGKSDVGVVTAIKGEKYLAEAAQKYQSLSVSGEKSLAIDHLKLSLTKHLGVLSQLQQKSPALHAALEEAVNVNKEVASSIRSL